MVTCGAFSRPNKTNPEYNIVYGMLYNACYLCAITNYLFSGICVVMVCLFISFPDKPLCILCKEMITSTI